MPHLGSNWEDVVSMLAPLLNHIGAMLGPFGARAGTGWAVVVTRSAKTCFHDGLDWPYVLD